MRSCVSEAALSPAWAISATRHHVGLTGSAPVAAYIPRTLHRGTRRLHIHQGAEVGIVLTGEQVRRFEDVAVSMQAGDVWLCAMWEPHEQHITSDEGSSLGIVFLPGFLGEQRFDGLSWLALLAAPPGERPRVTTDAMRRHMLAIAHRLRLEISRKRPGWMTAVRLGILQILFELGRDWEPRLPGRPGSAPSVFSLTRIMPALKLIQDDPAEATMVSDAAAVCGFSPAHFSRLFRRMIGMSFARFQTRARLAYVVHLLLTTSETIESIAHRAGFVDGSHLTHVFLRHYACTPGSYRRQAVSAEKVS